MMHTLHHNAVDQKHIAEPKEALQADMQIKVLPAELPVAGQGLAVGVTAWHGLPLSPTKHN